MRISDWSSDVCSSDLKRWKIGRTAFRREAAELCRLRQIGRSRKDRHDVGDFGARAVRGGQQFGAEEIGERAVIGAIEQRFGFGPALAAARAEDSSEGRRGGKEGVSAGSIGGARYH